MLNLSNVLSDVLDVANGHDGCTCESLSHVAGLEGWTDTANAMIMLLQPAATMLQADEDYAYTYAAHVLNIIMAVGYAAGADAAAETFQELEVPSTLEELEVLEPVRGEN